MKRPIGIFDSGVGGLTVFAEVNRCLPQEDIIYFGDTARVPYGSKSRDIIIQYSIQNVNFLVNQNIKLLIVACNSSSAYALDSLQERFKIPILGVIKPGVLNAIRITKNHKIGLIGTEATIKSKSYEKEMNRLKPDYKLISKSTPLLVPLVEENWLNHTITKQVIYHYLDDFVKYGIDTLILGCTHYPVLKKTIQEIVGKKVKLVDSAKSISKEIKIRNKSKIGENKGKCKFFVSDNPDKFRLLGKRILNKDLQDVQEVYFTETWVKKG